VLHILEIHLHYNHHHHLLLLLRHLKNRYTFNYMYLTTLSVSYTLYS
jgi:hypothetical protein